MAFVPIHQRITRERNVFGISVRPADGKKRQRAARACAHIPVPLQKALGWSDGDRIEVLVGTGSDLGRLLLRLAGKGAKGSQLNNGGAGEMAARNITFAVPAAMNPAKTAPVPCEVAITPTKELLVTLDGKLLRDPSEMPADGFATAPAVVVEEEAEPMPAHTLHGPAPELPPDQRPPVVTPKPESLAARQKAVEAPKPPPGPDTPLPAPKAATPTLAARPAADPARPTGNKVWSPDCIAKAADQKPAPVDGGHGFGPLADDIALLGTRGVTVEKRGDEYWWLEQARTIRPAEIRQRAKTVRQMIETEDAAD